MSYLSIRNPGVADYRAFTLLGVSTTRNTSQDGTIGQFGSGSKFSIALLLRLGIEVLVYCGNLKMKFFHKDEIVKGQVFRRVCVKYSGVDDSGGTKNSTDDLGFTLEWGVQDWKHISMAFREFVSNAIDGSICSGHSHNNVEFDIVESPRAKAGFTTVYLSATPEMMGVYANKDVLFLHFDNKQNQRCLPKRLGDESENVLIYKNGVLVSRIKGKSAFDYNLGNELTLDESRNATEWHVKYAVAKAIRNESAETLSKIMNAVSRDESLFESKLDESYMYDSWADNDVQTKRKKNFQEAWALSYGSNAVATSGNIALDSFVQQKGMKPVALSPNWMKTVESYGVTTENKILNKSEQGGHIEVAPTKDMVDCVTNVWNVMKAFNLTNGKGIPKVKSFTSIMESGAQTWAYYIHGGDTVYLHSSLGGKMMFKAALEEIVHYVTGANDMSRDIQDFLFNMITEMAS